jgi:hypothetical protein
MQRTRKTHQCQFEIQGNELERRAVPANMGNTFAIVSGEVVKAGELSQVKVNFDKNLFTLPKGKATIGVAVAPVSGGTVSPAISKVVNQANKSVAQASTPASRKISAAQSTTSTVPKPVIFNVQLGRGSAASTYTVSVKDQKTGTGNFLSGFYLPGDANGDLKVQKSDVDLIKGAIGAKTGDQKYNFNADSNRDGVIDNTDVKLAQQNMGVAVKVNPVITARLDPANDTGAADRITDQRNVNFQGVATPGSTLTYTEVDSKVQPVTAKADATGNYTITVGLADGNNLFRVTSTDPFGQSISGLLSPVTYRTDPPAASA